MISSNSRPLMASATARTGSGSATAPFTVAPVAVSFLMAASRLSCASRRASDGGPGNVETPPMTGIGTGMALDARSFTGVAGSPVTSNSNALVVDSLTLSNLVFDDNNNNGLFDGADVGIDDVDLTLFADTNNDGLLDAGDTQLATTTTAGLTGASAGTQASRTEESIPATCALIAHTAATVTIVAASPITTAISPRPRRRTRI